jgi:hypothetical protein
VLDMRAPWFDYFTADTDTSHGSSGGPAFDSDFALLGVLARGEPDWEETASGCRTALRVSPTPAHGEQFTFAHRALEGLCSNGLEQSSLCRADCAEPCPALPVVALGVPGSCSISLGVTSSTGSCTLGFGFAPLGAFFWSRRRKARRPANAGSPAQQPCNTVARLRISSSSIRGSSRLISSNAAARRGHANCSATGRSQSREHSTKRGLDEQQTYTRQHDRRRGSRACS